MAYRSLSVWLEDVINAIEKINSYTADIANYEDYLSSSLIVDATERNLEIIAEAIKNAERLEPDIPISNIRQIIGLRNLITHRYFVVEYDIIWKIIKHNLPVLFVEVKRILEDFEKRLELNEL